jgi:hypothetical protein
MESTFKSCKVSLAIFSIIAIEARIFGPYNNREDASALGAASRVKPLFQNVFVSGVFAELADFMLRSDFIVNHSHRWVRGKLDPEKPCMLFNSLPALMLLPRSMQQKFT